MAKNKCPNCEAKLKRITKFDFVEIYSESFKVPVVVLKCTKCDYKEIDIDALKKLMKTVAYKKPMSSSSCKQKGSKFEKQIAKSLHESCMMYVTEYKQIFEQLGNDSLKPSKDAYSGKNKNSDSDINLGLAKKWIPLAIEAKHHACMLYSINNVINGRMSEIFEAFLQSKIHSEENKKEKLTPVVMFKGNNMKALCLFDIKQIKLDLKDVDYIKKNDYRIVDMLKFFKLYLTSLHN